jgi:D-aminopeptidase
MKFYLMTDLEGVAGVYQWENREDTSLENHERRMRQRRWLAQEVSAGDAYASREMEALIPGLVTVPVKVGLSRLSALQRTPAQAREMIREGAERALKGVGEIAPFRLASPILFRDERVKPTFDEENPPPHARVIDAHTCEIEGEDIIDLMYKIYPGYPRDWKPLELAPAR